MNMYVYIYRVIYGLKQTLCELLDEQISIKTGNFRYTLWTIHDAMAAMVGLNRSLLPLVWRLRRSLQTPAGAKVTADNGRSSLEGRKRGPMKLLGRSEQWLLDIPFISVMRPSFIGVKHQAEELGSRIGNHQPQLLITYLLKKGILELVL